MGFKINVDRFGFAKEPKPEKVSRDYAAEYVKSLVDNEANARSESDTELHNAITAESNARETDKAELQGEINSKIAQEVTARNAAIILEKNERSAKDEELEEKINQETSLRNAKDAELKKYIEDCVAAEATLRESELESISTTISEEAAARANEDKVISGRLNRLTDQERSARIAKDTELEEAIRAEGSTRETDKAELRKEIDGKFDEVKGVTDGLKSDMDGIQQQINTEAHFKGYLSTNAKIQALEATPNDFAYSAESGTVWIYDVEEGWQDSGEAVPDQLTPASDVTPLVDGTASVGNEQAYARGDHRHPTDTSRASVNQLNDWKGELESKIELVGDFELIESVTLTENVNAIVPDLKGNRYKEIYCYLRIQPRSNADPNNRDGRISITDSGVSQTIELWNQQNWLVDDFNEAWEMSVHMKAFGKLCSTKVWFYKYNKTSYARTPNAATFAGGEAPFKELEKPYFDNIGILFSSQDGVRSFTKGSQYQIWGVRA